MPEYDTNESLPIPEDGFLQDELPEDEDSDADELELEDEATLTWYVDPMSHQLQGMTDDFQAFVQTIETILSIERDAYSIYEEDTGIELDGLVGTPNLYILAELPRRIEEAFETEDRIEEIETQLTESTDEYALLAHIQMKTVYGDYIFDKEIHVA